MPLDQLDIIKRQAESAVRNKLSGAAARVRSETSLVKQAGQLTGRVSRQLKQGEQAIHHAARTRSHQVADATVAEHTAVPVKTPDGYIRRSPVQPIHVPADYRRRIVRKVLGLCLLAAVVLTALWLLLKTGLLAY